MRIVPSGVGIVAIVSTAAENLARYVRSLPNFAIHESGSYNHMGATIADAVLQANMKYSTHVEPRMNRILVQYPEARTISALVRLLSSISVKDFLSWRGEDRCQRFARIVRLFESEGIDTEADLRSWLAQDANREKLRSIKGIGPKTIDYFKILVGESTSAIDRHLLGFLKLAGIEAASYREAQDVINATADLLGIDRAHFDYSIWQFMSKGLSSCGTYEVAPTKAEGATP